MVYKALYNNFGIWMVYKRKKAIWNCISTFFVFVLQQSYIYETFNCKYLNQFDKIELKHLILSAGLLAGASPETSKVASEPIVATLW